MWLQITSIFGAMWLFWRSTYMVNFGYFLISMAIFVILASLVALATLASLATLATLATFRYLCWRNCDFFSSYAYILYDSKNMPVKPWFQHPCS